MENVCKDAHDSILGGECSKRGWSSQLCPEGGGFRAYVNGSRYWSLDVEDAARGALKLARDQFYQEQATKEDIMNEEQNEATEGQTANRTEQKRQAFHKVAPGRVEKVVKAMRLLGQCANVNGYEYTTEEVSAMVNELEKELDKLTKLFCDYRGVTGYRFGFGEGVISR